MAKHFSVRSMMIQRLGSVPVVYRSSYLCMFCVPYFCPGQKIRPNCETTRTNRNLKIWRRSTSIHYNLDDRARWARQEGIMLARRKCFLAYLRAIFYHSKSDRNSTTTSGHNSLFLDVSIVFAYPGSSALHHPQKPVALQHLPVSFI